MTTITDSSVVVAVPEQISTEVADERVVLHPETGQYHGLSDVAARIWDHVQEPTEVAEVHESLVAEYAVDPEQCRRDLIAFLEALEAAQLVDVE